MSEAWLAAFAFPIVPFQPFQISGASLIFFPHILGILSLESGNLCHPINNIYLYHNMTHFSIEGVITHHLLVLHHGYLTETGKCAVLWRPDPFSEVYSRRHFRELQPPVLV